MTTCTLIITILIILMILNQPLLQSRFLKDLNMDVIDALMHFNLAPLESRRDIAMLGLIHRTVLGGGPKHFQEHFKRRADGKIVDPRLTCKGELAKRSALGLVAVYNLLSMDIKSCTDVKSFQAKLQAVLKERAEEGCTDWANTFSPRTALWKHPLMEAPTYK